MPVCCCCDTAVLRAAQRGHQHRTVPLSLAAARPPNCSPATKRGASRPISAKLSESALQPASRGTRPAQMRAAMRRHAHMAMKEQEPDQEQVSYRIRVGERVSSSLHQRSMAYDASGTPLWGPEVGFASTQHGIRCVRDSLWGPEARERLAQSIRARAEQISD